MYIKTQPKTIDLSTRLWRINLTNSVSIPQSLVYRGYYTVVRRYEFYVQVARTISHE